MEVRGLVCQARCCREEDVLVAGGFGHDGPQSPARGECSEHTVTRGSATDCPQGSAWRVGPGSPGPSFMKMNPIVKSYRTHEI